jgi:hypothetical protein
MKKGGKKKTRANDFKKKPNKKIKNCFLPMKVEKKKSKLGDAFNFSHLKFLIS